MPIVPDNPHINFGQGMDSDLFLKLSNYSKKSIDKSVEQMKEFMEKDVEELAYGESPAREIINVRGKKLVVPLSGRRRKDAIFVACLYALEDPKVDAILKAINVKGYFEAEDGSTELREFFEQEDKKPIERGESKKPGRNILLPEAEKAEEKKDQWVAILDESGGVKTIGIISTWNVDSEAPDYVVRHVVRTVDGEDIKVPAERLELLNGLAQLIECSRKIGQRHL